MAFDNSGNLYVAELQWLFGEQVRRLVPAKPQRTLNGLSSTLLPWHSNGSWQRFTSANYASWRQ